MMIDKIVTHSKTVLDIAKRQKWLIGARYTNLRNITTFATVDFIDINWKRYDFCKHLACVKNFQPKYTVACDWEKASDLKRILIEADKLAEFCEKVIIVPKVFELRSKIIKLIPERYLLGFSVPTRYGSTTIDPKYFDDRPVHLLGGRPEKQRHLANMLNVKSIDCNRFTLDARFGDYFDGHTFRPHPEGGYKKCLEDSIRNISQIWKNYNCNHLSHPEK